MRQPEPHISLDETKKRQHLVHGIWIGLVFWLMIVASGAGAFNWRRGVFALVPGAILLTVWFFLLWRRKKLAHSQSPTMP